MDSAFRRRAIAVVAAYALALHGLLLAFVPAAAMASQAPFATLCAHDGGTAPADRSDPHDLPCAALCAVSGHGIATPAPAGLHVIVARLVPRAIAAPADERLAPRHRGGPPQLPRGPPLA